MSKNMLDKLCDKFLMWTLSWSFQGRSSEARRHESDMDSVEIPTRKGTLSKKILDQFGALLMEVVRDYSITQLNGMLRKKGRLPEGKKLNKLYKSLSSEERDALEKLIQIAVDITLHDFLWLIEQEPDLDLVMKTPDEVKSLRDESDGLSGEIYSIDGWIAQFSKHPSSEDFSVYQKYLKLF